MIARVVTAWSAVKAQPTRWAPALAVTAVLTVLYGPMLVDHLICSNNRWWFADDARIWIFSLFPLEDRSLFVGDRIVDYLVASTPLGYRALYGVLGPVLGVRVVSKMLPYLLYGAALAAIGASSRRLGGRSALFGSLALALGSSYALARMGGGLPRAFGLPLLAAGACCLVAGRARTLGVLTIVAGALYPVVAVTLGACFALLLFLPRIERGSAAAWSFSRRAYAVSAAGVATALVVMPTILRLRPWGPPATPADWARYPETGPLGRVAGGSDLPPFEGLSGGFLHAWHDTLPGAGEPLAPPFHWDAPPRWLFALLLVICAAGLVTLARRGADARRFLIFPVSVAFAHTLARLAFPHFYSPERHLTYGAAIFGFIGLPSALGALVAHPNSRFAALPALWNLALLAVLGGYGSTTAGLTVHVAPSDIELFRAIAKLPPNVLIAGWPDETMDDLPYLTARRAFITHETHMPYHVAYVAMLRQRMLRVIEAYYSSSPEALTRLRNEDHVTHVLLDRRYFKSPPHYFAPFDDAAARAFEHGRKDGFAAEHGIERAKVLAIDRYVLLDLSRL